MTGNDIILIKSQIIKMIRDFFNQQKFIEVDTPNLVQTPDPSTYHEVFETTGLNQQRLFLITSPEFNLKKMISRGGRNIYQITKVYRDSKETDQLHLKEFLMLEWYRDQANYFDLIADCENLFRYMFQAKNDIKMVIKPPTKQVSWMKISCREAFSRYAGIDLDKFCLIDQAKRICKQKGYRVEGFGWEQLYHQVFLNEIEPNLKTFPALFLYDYPAQLAELSQIKKENPGYAERFEWYINGIEVGNGYSELTDWREQKSRLVRSIKYRKKKGMKVFDCDPGLVAALKRGLPKTAGIAVGIERLVMALTGIKDIHQVAPYNL